MAKGIQDERYQAVVDALKAARKRLGLNQTVFGARLGQRQQFVSKYESGERRLDVIEFVDVAKALDLDWSKLLQKVDRG